MRYFQPVCKIGPILFTALHIFLTRVQNRAYLYTDPWGQLRSSGGYTELAREISPPSAASFCS